MVVVQGNERRSPWRADALALHSASRSLSAPARRFILRPRDVITHRSHLRSGAAAADDQPAAALAAAAWRPLRSSSRRRLRRLPVAARFALPDAALG